MFYWVVIATSIWMAVDSSKIGYDKRDIKGLAAIGPVGWLFAGLFLWIVTFPLYLIKRPELKAAAERKRQMLAYGQGVPGQLMGQGYPPQGYPPQGYPPAQGYPEQGYPPMPPQQAYGQPSSGQPSQPSPDVEQGLRKLEELRTSGLLSDAEFQQQKAQLLARI